MWFEHDYWVNRAEVDMYSDPAGWIDVSARLITIKKVHANEIQTLRQLFNL